MCQQSSHISHHYFSYTAFPAWEEFSVKNALRTWFVSELHRRQYNDRNTEISHSTLQMLGMYSSVTELGLIHTPLQEMLMSPLYVKNITIGLFTNVII